eukprot:gb/GECG01013328.1/.p1 GENE.gb/GECG01013328.1/~~gb/GECG01013328.1/.p1  ORF type:complete len:880 (+),score=84.21 gb/GECG01013328.1/:1-2640(+)
MDREQVQNGVVDGHSDSGIGGMSGLPPRSHTWQYPTTHQNDLPLTPPEAGAPRNSSKEDDQEGDGPSAHPQQQAVAPRVISEGSTAVVEDRDMKQNPRSAPRRRKYSSDLVADVEEPSELKREVDVLDVQADKSCTDKTKLRWYRFVKRAYKRGLVRLGLYPYARQVNYVMRQLIEQIGAVVPLTFYLALFIAVFYQKAPDNVGGISLGLGSMILGLLLFLEGIKISCMPIGETIGRELSQKFHTFSFLFICFCLGIVATYAEPAIAALGPLRAFVKAERTPFLYLMLNDWSTYLVITIACGVGTATAIGTWRMKTGKPLLPQVCAVVTPVLLLMCYMMWWDTDLRSVIGLAWDCGAITTGPITASAILAISSGISKGANGSTSNGSGNLGVVTLTPLYPILYVEILAVIMSATVDKDKIRSRGSGDSTSSGDGGSLMEATQATLQAALPLTSFFLFVLKAIVRKPIPNVTWSYVLEDSENDEKSGRSKADAEVRKTNQSEQTTESTNGNEPPPGSDEALEEALAEHYPQRDEQWSISSQNEGGSHLVPFLQRSPERRYKTVWHVFPGMGRKGSNKRGSEGNDSGEEDTLETNAQETGAQRNAAQTEIEMASVSQQRNSHRSDAERDTGSNAPWDKSGEAVSQTGLSLPALKNWIVQNSIFLSGILCIPVGLFLTNIGIQFALTPLGDEAGSRMPSLFMNVDGTSEEKLFPKEIGLFVAAAYIFLLGVFVAKAEPALVVLGLTVEELTRGTFSRAKLQRSVGIGVGIGASLGLLQLIFAWPMLYVLLPGYAVALVLSTATEETIRCASWDSGGVAAGPVSVPLVLAMGISFGNASNATESFGILACASMCPIVSVLTMNSLTRITGRSTQYHRVYDESN